MATCYNNPIHGTIEVGMRMGKPFSMINPWPGGGVRIFDRIGSTMDAAMDWAREGCAEGSVVIAGYQEAGRGRFADRRWLSDPWQSLLGTVILEAGDWAGDRLTALLSGLAVSDAIRDLYDVASRIKWPNDVMVEGRKISGILCERREGRLLVGFGVNVDQREFPGDLARTAVSLRQVLGREAEIGQLCARFLARLHAAVGEVRTGSSAWRMRLQDRLERMGQEVTVRTGGREGILSGRISGVDLDGALLLLAEDGSVRRVVSGEI
jgi:BirA family transcriptional regulator, biotin operon repressor / biotin---[acetyl-CoA-carboxylase] ligase